MHLSPAAIEGAIRLLELKSDEQGTKTDVQGMGDGMETGSPSKDKVSKERT